MDTLSKLIVDEPKTDEEWDAHCDGMRRLLEDEPNTLSRPELGVWIKRHRSEILAAASRRTRCGK